VAVWLKEVHELVHAELVALDLVAAERGPRDLPLLLLQLEDPLLDRVLDRELGDLDVTLLPETVRTVERLLLR
jgi:hypothetical protein